MIARVRAYPRSARVQATAQRRDELVHGLNTRLRARVLGDDLDDGCSDHDAVDPLRGHLSCFVRRIDAEADHHRQPSPCPQL